MNEVLVIIMYSVPQFLSPVLLCYSDFNEDTITTRGATPLHTTTNYHKG